MIISVKTRMEKRNSEHKPPVKRLQFKVLTKKASNLSDEQASRRASVVASTKGSSNQVFSEFCDDELPVKHSDSVGEPTTKERRMEKSEKKFEKIISKLDLAPCETQMRMPSTQLWRLNSQQIEINA